MTQKKREMLRMLRETLRFHKAIGIETYPFNRDVQRFLEAEAGPARAAAKPSGSRPADDAVAAGIDHLDREIGSCTRCHLSSDPLGRVPGKGKKGCRLMVVGDWSSQSGDFSADILFGREEDLMLWKMMAAIELQPYQVYVTNCLKCCPADPSVIEGKCEEACFSFLTREIAAINPQVICAMGETASRVLLGRREPLARLRGRFGRYRYQADREVMVMPTFHPRFLLGHQELKKATWNDLLAIKRQLDETA